MVRVSSSKAVSGYIMALTAAILWGISGTVAQFLFEQKSIAPDWLVTWRMLIAGIILLSYGFSKARTDIQHIWKKPKDGLELFLFGAIGMVTVQYTYFYSISLSNAATATILQYVGPVFVVAFYAIKYRRWPTWREYAALFLASVGIFLLVTHGTIESLVISKDAIIWGILSALALAFYTIQPVQLLQRFSSNTVTAWGMLIGGVTFALYTQPWYWSGIWDIETYLAVGFIIVFGTVIPFSIFLHSLNLIGAQTASLLCSVEPLSAAITAVVWLGILFTGMDWLGTILILLTVALLTLKKTSQTNEPTSHT
jgi:drug/metabolite transporter (DMT)-like permease